MRAQHGTVRQCPIPIEKRKDDAWSGVRTHADKCPADLKSAPLDLSGIQALASPGHRSSVTHPRAAAAISNNNCHSHICDPPVSRHPDRLRCDDRSIKIFESNLGWQAIYRAENDATGKNKGRRCSSPPFDQKTKKRNFTKLVFCFVLCFEAKAPRVNL